MRRKGVESKLNPIHLFIVRSKPCTYEGESVFVFQSGINPIFLESRMKVQSQLAPPILMSITLACTF